MTVDVSFPLLGEKITCSPSTTVAQACTLVGYPPNLVCGGRDLPEMLAKHPGRRPD